MDAGRFVLTSAQLADSFASAGCFPRQAEFFAGLPAAANPSREIDSTLRALIEAVADPAFTLRLSDFRQSGPASVEICVVRGRAGPYAAFARTGPDHWELTPFESHASLMAQLDGLVRGGEPAEAEHIFRELDGTADSTFRVNDGICRSCGTLYDDSPAFCRECGAPFTV